MKRWEATTSTMSVTELEAGSGSFSVSSCSYGGADDEDDENNERDKGNHTKARLPLQRKSTHIVKPSETWCSCGQWQDTLLPCRHACAVYRKHKEVEMTYITENKVNDYYSYKLAKKMFKKNIFPVSVDTLGYDGLTNPPVNSRRSVRRPRWKRYRRRSLYAAAEDSPTLCSNCSGAGHNRRIGSRGPGERIPNSLLQAEEGNDEHEEGKDEHEEGKDKREGGKDEDEEGWEEDEEGKEEHYEESNNEAEEESNDEDEEASNDEDEERCDDKNEETSEEGRELLNNYTYKRRKRCLKYQ